MPSAQSYGATPDANYGNPWAGIMASMAGVMQGQKDYTDQQQAKQDKNDEQMLKLIEIGMNAKTVRPAQDGEKADLKYKGQGFVYDNSGNEDERKMGRYLNARKNAVDQMNKEDVIRAQQGLQPLDDGTRQQRIEKYTALNMGGKLNDDGSVEVPEAIKNNLPDGLQGIWDNNVVGGKTQKGNPGKAADAPGTPGGNAMAAARASDPTTHMARNMVAGLGAGWLAKSPAAQKMLSAGMQRAFSLLPTSAPIGIPGAGNIPGAMMTNPGVRSAMTGMIPQFAAAVPRVMGGAAIGIPVGQMAGQGLGNMLPVNNPVGQAVGNAAYGFAQNQNIPLWFRSMALGQDNVAAVNGGQ